MISPHGGKLINRIATGEERKELLKKAASLYQVNISLRELCDAELIACGAFSPLSDFMVREDHVEVLENMRLKSGVLWPLPVTLSIDRERASEIKEGQEVSLNYEGNIIAVLSVEEKYAYDKSIEAKSVFKTIDVSHPGVAALYKQGDVYLGGKLTLLNSPLHDAFEEALKPEESRRLFELRNWNKVVAFQTRNPIHRAHEYLLKCALEISDGIFIHPLVGHTKEDDVPSEVRMRCYRALIENYFPVGRVILSPFPVAMRYAGPREAVFHAIVRKNYGCTHIIIGRDHAGVGRFYGPFDAQKIFSEFKSEEIGIAPIFFDNAFYCYRCESMATYKTCPHQDQDRLILSGTKVREILKRGEKLPREFTRPEVAELLHKWILESERSEVSITRGDGK